MRCDFQDPHGRNVQPSREVTQRQSANPILGTGNIESVQFLTVPTTELFHREAPNPTSLNPLGNSG